MKFLVARYVQQLFPNYINRKKQKNSSSRISKKPKEILLSIPKFEMFIVYLPFEFNF